MIHPSFGQKGTGAHQGGGMGLIKPLSLTVMNQMAICLQPMDLGVSFGQYFALVWCCWLDCPWKCLSTSFCSQPGVRKSADLFIHTFLKLHYWTLTLEVFQTSTLITGVSSLIPSSSQCSSNSVMHASVDGAGSGIALRLWGRIRGDKKNGGSRGAGASSSAVH
ncbi:hypothetical protein Tco_0562486 [Tanacetum coccineum]